MAFARHNIEKNRLIEMVRQNPILWDCRLPHYKRSDKKKDIKWCELGRAFNVSGERVQRTFTSLREIFRRELNNEKLLGARFTSKWEYYGAMSFLKDVIRERKTRERYRHDGIFKDMLHDYDYSCAKSQSNANSSMSQQQADNPMNDSPLNLEISSSRSSTPSISIKEEATDHDGDDECVEDRSKPIKRSRKNPQSTRWPTNQEPTAPSTSNYHNQNANKNLSTTTNYTKTLSDDDDNEREEESITVIKQTPREILYTKFGEFLSARLNTLNETVANDLMNRILLLVAENR